jgi:hypothetical protein
MSAGTTFEGQPLVDAKKEIKKIKEDEGGFAECGSRVERDGFPGHRRLCADRPRGAGYLAVSFVLFGLLISY